MCRKWNKIFKRNTDGFQFYGGIHLSDLYNEQVFIACKLTGKNTQRLISCKNKEKLPLENLVSANMKLFGRIHAVTETDGNTEKQVRLPDRIFTFPPVERTK